MGDLNYLLRMPILDDDSAAQIYELLQDFVRVFESHYGTQLNAYYYESYANDTQGDQRSFNDDVPF